MLISLEKINLLFLIFHCKFKNLIPNWRSKALPDPDQTLWELAQDTSWGQDERLLSADTIDLHELKVNAYLSLLEDPGVLFVKSKIARKLLAFGGKYKPLIKIALEESIENPQTMPCSRVTMNKILDQYRIGEGESGVENRHNLCQREKQKSDLGGGVMG